MTLRFPASSSLARRVMRRARRVRPGRGNPDGNLRAVRRRPPAPPYWRNIAPALRAVPPKSVQDRLRHWLLVLQAKGIRYRFFERGRHPSLYVPPVAARTALHEILAFEGERPTPPLPHPMERRGLYWYAALVALLIPWHRLRWGEPTPLSFLPATARDWLIAAGLDAYRVSVTGEWWRAVTSLTLHADSAHLVSNLVMGVIFGIPLCRHTGVGFGFLLTLVAGTCGNILTAYLRPASFLSQGFSTAVFASVGLLAAFAAAFAGKHTVAHASDNREGAAFKQGMLKGILPLGAGLGFLAMLGGSDAPRVDYLAHTMGLAAGIIIGVAVSFGAPKLLVLSGTKDTILQTVSLSLSAALLILCWSLALR